MYILIGLDFDITPMAIAFLSIRGQLGALSTEVEEK